MKKKGILWVLLSVLLIVSLSGCKGGGIVGKSAECKSLINKFEKSCNEVDIQAILDCIDPKISDPIKAIVAIFICIRKHAAYRNTVDGQEHIPFHKKRVYRPVYDDRVINNHNVEGGAFH